MNLWPLEEIGGHFHAAGNSDQILLGVVDHVAYVEETNVLGRDDLVVAVTDACSSCDGDKMLGEAWFPDEPAQKARLPTRAVAERIRRLVADFTDAPQHDDMAIAAIRILQGALRSPVESRPPDEPTSVQRSGQAARGPIVCRRQPGPAQCTENRSTPRTGAWCPSRVTS